MILLDVLGFMLLIFLIFSPTLIAHHRHLQKLKILFIINLIAGWTVIFWIPLLAWCIISEKKEAGFEPIARHA